MSAVRVVAGLVFALGLGLSGMTQPAKIRAFLDVTGAWDPSLAFVMIGAVGVYFAVERLTRGRLHPRPPLVQGIDARLVVGAVIFGVGWGLSGFCPGPAIVSIGGGVGAALWFVPAMVAGMALYRLLSGATDRG
jgi:uncharacterized membrane protein YedE/YeeE